MIVAFSITSAKVFLVMALVGSFGAEIVPAAYDLLPDHVRRRVAQVSLLGLQAKGDWEIKIMGWLGSSASEDATAVEPALAQIPSPLIQCIYGAGENESECPSLTARGAEIVKMEGGHHFDGDYVGLARHILAGFRRRAGIEG